MFRGRGTGLRAALVGSVALFALTAGLAQAQEANFAIPAQPLSQTLRDIARRTGGNILFTPESVSGLRAPALSGKMSAQDAVARALSGSGLEAVPDGSGGIIVQKKTLPRSEPTPSDQASLSGEPSVETVVVTGSRIPQTALTSPSPVVVIGHDELKYEGATDVTTVLNNLPEVFVSQNNNVSNGATGTDNVNLRDLGAQRTLVLINGSRQMPGDPDDLAADINTIPAALVDHIDVLTGGASAVYGSDALAGVVNFVLRQDFEGIELNGTYTITQNDNDTARWRDLTQAQINQGALNFAQSPLDVWDGQTTDLTLLMGTNTDNGKGNVSIYLGYRNSAAILQSSREYSECTLYPSNQGDICQGSPNFNNWLSFDNTYGGKSSFFYETGTGKPGSGAFIPYTGAPNETYNFNPDNYFQRPDTRYTGGFFGHYDISKELELYSSMMFMGDHSVAQIAPSGIFFGSGNQEDFSVYVNCANPLMTLQENYTLCGELPGDQLVSTNGRSYWNGAGNAKTLNPFGVAGQSELYIARRDVEGGPRTFDLEHQSYRMQIGARGELGNDWSYNLYAQYGYTNFQQGTTGEFSESRVQNALQVDPVTGQCYAAETGSSRACVPLDIFNGIGSITPAMLKYVSADAQELGWTQEGIVSGSMTGDLGDWGVKSPWARTSATAVLGAEYRQEASAFLPDLEYQIGDIEGTPAIPAVPAGGFNVGEGFTEIQLPVVQNIPMVEDATLKGGYRYSSYSAAGSTNTWYAAADWQVMDDVRYRASMQRAVRAPNVLELFTPQTTASFEATYPGSDPCRTITTGQCAKVPNDGTLLLACPEGVCNDQVGGNTALKPETSTTRTIGIVFTPTFLDGFSATVDWWNIDVSNYIAVLPVQEILNDCYGRTATAASEGYFCPFVHRTALGQLYGGGYVSDDNVNTGYLKTNGVDYQVNYSSDTVNWIGRNEGTVSVNLIGTWLDRLINEPVPVAPLTRDAVASYDCAGYYGVICTVPAPRWRQKFRLTWASPYDVTLSLQWRFIGATKLDADTTSPLLGGGPGNFQCPNTNFSVSGYEDCSDAHISSYSYFDLSASWQMRQGVEFRAGVNNIFDIEPPILTQYVFGGGIDNGNSVTGLYDVLGRTVFVAASIKY